MLLKTNLLSHQSLAVDKLSKLKIGALYMEMGTGKTRTALELIKMRLDAGKVDHIIWLCPCSVKSNLLNDINKHSDLNDLGILTICGIETLSSSIRMVSELLQVVSNKKTYLIVDESLLVKNPNALRSINITRLASYCKYKLILNGTPISKNEADLFSQWYLLDWRILGYRSYWSFEANHIEYDDKHPERIRRTLNVDYLVQKIEPYTFQVKKSECFDLPSKIYETQTFSMTESQQENYDYVVEKLLDELDELSSESIYRLLGALQSVISGFAIKVYDDHHTERYPMFNSPLDNPRIKVTLAIIKNEIPENEKIIIFCNYVKEIEELVNILNAQAPYSAVPFYGEVPQKKRQGNLELFRNKAKVLVANKSCGAFGLNLQFCHNIIYHSNDWNWGTRIQSEDRVHRMGQEHRVNIWDVSCCGSIDVSILHCLHEKENLVDKFKSELNKHKLKEMLIYTIKGGKNGKNISKTKCI